MKPRNQATQTLGLHINQEGACALEVLEESNPNQSHDVPQSTSVSVREGLGHDLNRILVGQVRSASASHELGMVALQPCLDHFPKIAGKRLQLGGLALRRRACPLVVGDIAFSSECIELPHGRSVELNR